MHGLKPVPTLPSPFRNLTSAEGARRERVGNKGDRHARAENRLRATTVFPGAHSRWLLIHVCRCARLSEGG